MEYVPSGDEAEESLLVGPVSRIGKRDVEEWRRKYDLPQDLDIRKLLEHSFSDRKTLGAFGNLSRPANSSSLEDLDRDTKPRRFRALGDRSERGALFVLCC